MIMKIHVKIQNRTYEVKIGNIHDRPIQAIVDGDIFEVWPEEMTTPSEGYIPEINSNSKQKLKNIGIEQPSSSVAVKNKQVIAPIPGVIISISAKEGQNVDFGQELCILEAMKMKNSIRASRNGIISKIFVSAGESVQHSQVLMEFSE